MKGDTQPLRSAGARLKGLEWVWRALLLGAVYFVVAKLGLRYATIGPSISPVWPPTGLAIAALVVLGVRYWPAVLVGAFLANATTSVPILAALGIACGNATEAMIAAYLLRRRWGPHVGFDELGSVRTFAGIAAPLGAFASAAIGVTTLWVSDVIAGRDFLTAVGLWWAGDYLGALVVAPVLLAWRPSESQVERREILELLVLVAGAVLATAFIFGNLIPASFLQPAQYPYLLFPFVVGAALRFGPRGATALTLTVALLAVGYTVRGGGPFVMHSVPSTDVSLLIYVGVLAITGLVMSPAVARRLKAERALREAHGHLQAVINSSPLAIYTIDAEGDVRSWNPAAETLYGWSADEVRGGPLAMITRDMEDQQGLRDRVFRGETVRGRETTTQKKDGTPVTVSLAAAPFHDAFGRVTGMLFIAADLTEVRQLEVQYRQAQKMEAVGRLAGGIAHDFNNLLTAILGTTGLLLESVDTDSRTRLDIEEIERAAKRAAGLTRQLLVFSRQQVLEPRVLDLNAVVVDLERMLGRLIGEDVELHTNLAAELGAVQADPGQAYSEPGHGTTFKIYLPRVAGTPEKAVSQTPASLAVGSETVLLVEDQAEVRRLTMRILEARGYTVLAAENGAAAAQLADQYLKRIDLLLTDVVMPGVNGRELAVRLTAQRRDIKVLFVSGYTGEAIRQHGLLELGAAFLQKPFTPEVLARKVREILDTPGPN